MKWNSIRAKVVVALAACLILCVGGTSLLLRYSFERDSQALASESVTHAQRLFNILEAREISKMGAVGEMLAANPLLRDALTAQDRKRLLAVAGPLYPKLAREGITNWVFHTPEPKMAVFLRVHNPTKFGEYLDRFVDREVVRTHVMVSGNESGKGGFAVRTIRPFYDSRGAIIGYIEFGEEIGRFVREMKSQTGDDYGLLLNKKFVDRRLWASSSAMWKRRDNWDDHPNFVVAEKTTASDSIIQFQGGLGEVPGSGKVLERFSRGDSVFVRGIFPIGDAGHNTVGAMFVVRDISGVYVTMRNTRNLLVMVSVVGLALGALFLLALLNRLVFRRLEHIIVVATRVVGGDYESEVQVDSSDEIGHFERLFEQFRCVFVDVLAHVPEFQEKR